MRRAGLWGIVAIAITSWTSQAGAELPAELRPVEGKVVWIDFWASWCAPCRRSFPWMNAMHEKYGPKGLAIIAINVDKDRALADAFLEESPAAFRLHYDPAGELALEFDVQAMPSSFLLDHDGNVLARHYGFKLANTDEYEQEIRSALAE
jgi:thiol-disulfide isomerase/thioredoxin